MRKRCGLTRHDSKMTKTVKSNHSLDNNFPHKLLTTHCTAIKYKCHVQQCRVAR